jgi:uncharacterized membrane protein YeiH
MSTTTALVSADLAGVAVFAASGASAALGKRLDLFGVVFVGFVAALGGGLIRDLAIDRVPPLVFADWRYSVTAAVTSVIVFFVHPHLERIRRAVLVLDAAGLGLFTAGGTLVAEKAGVPAVGACILGMLTGIGGGLARDILTGEIPVVLRQEVYALAALLGAIVVAVGYRAGAPGTTLMLSAAALIFVVRIVALRQRWSVPTPKPSPPIG